MMDELKETVETLIELDEPEAMLATIRRAAERQKGARWQRVAHALAQAQASLDKEHETPADAKLDDEADTA
jgi:hypothetical protein